MGKGVDKEKVHVVSPSDVKYGCVDYQIECPVRNLQNVRGRLRELAYHSDYRGILITGAGSR